MRQRFFPRKRRDRDDHAGALQTFQPAQIMIRMHLVGEVGFLLDEGDQIVERYRSTFRRKKHADGGNGILAHAFKQTRDVQDIGIDFGDAFFTNELRHPCMGRHVVFGGDIRGHFEGHDILRWQQAGKLRANHVFIRQAAIEQQADLMA